MKKLLVTLFLQSLSFLGNAQGNSVFNLKSYGGPVVLQIDNRSYNRPDSYFSIRNIAPGDHYLRIRRLRNRRGREMAMTVYKGHLNVPAASVINASVERREYRVNSIMAMSSQPAQQQPDNTVIAEPNSTSQAEPQPQAQPQPSPSTPPQIVSENDFKEFKESLLSTGLASTRLDMAKKYASEHSLNSSQVKEVNGMFNNDSDKLDFSKAAYPNTTDKNNFSQVDASFQTDGAKNDLHSFIESQK
jgi:hypothetical protein